MHTRINCPLTFYIPEAIGKPVDARPPCKDFCDYDGGISCSTVRFAVALRERRAADILRQLPDSQRESALGLLRLVAGEPDAEAVVPRPCGKISCSAC